MNSDELIEHSRRLILAAEGSINDMGKMKGTIAQICEFLKRYAGTNSAFFETAKFAQQYNNEYASKILIGTLNSFIDYVKAGLLSSISPERKAQLDVVSDFLEQANDLLQTNGIHPAAPAVIIGATLESV